MKKVYDLTTLKITKAIVHDIPKHKKNDFSLAPIFSQQESSLTDELKLFFKDSIIKALGRDRAFKICYDPSTLSPVNNHVNEILYSDQTFVNNSIEIGQHLYNIQKGYNASGILFILKCELSDRVACVIMKLERDGGAQLTLNPKTNSFDISEVKNLMLTAKTKLFKISLLFDRSKFGCDYDGSLMDYQINIKQKKELTSFFIDDFLGCKPYEDPKVTTQRFYNLTRTFIETVVQDKIEQAKNVQDLNSYLQTNKNQLSPKEFSDLYLTTPFIQDEYKSFLKTKRFLFATFNKDLSLIKQKIEKFMIVFKNGIMIFGNKGKFKENVELKELPNGDHQATVISEIRKIE
ncbi:hypothetical protein A7A78_02910 [Aequorivita soesokkakensis]|jgi:hypothetical protein|uniref:Nucleoid-associated protein n=1 Tax=Aequorivita soesokkakensis TaxID=1385699 RepID=A0A1A9LFH3_9FLAO|nr:nucleoid-associated protein [Aequorivita soesokkakensis]OAD91462.1 hypothetical protein A7A78_02910 [Aequorivita soesokkakensis]